MAGYGDPETYYNGEMKLKEMAGKRDVKEKPCTHQPDMKAKPCV